MITLDTSGVLALLNRSDPEHRQAREAHLNDPGPYLLPAGILAEVGYLVERRLGMRVLATFLEDLMKGSVALDCGDQDLPRVHQLVQRYKDLPLGLADACVIACAERNGGRVLTLDRRHFGTVAHEGRLTLLPG